MERSKHFITLILLMFCFTTSQANYKSKIYNAFITNNMNQWQRVVDEMQTEANKSNEFLMELVNYQYGYIAWSLGNKKHDLAEKYLSLAEKNLEVLEKSGYKLSMVNAYKSAFYGYHIGLNIFKAPFIGLNSIDCAKLAMQLDEQNPFGYIQYGNSQYYMPEIFGGSKKVALEYFIKAEKLMVLHTQNVEEDWNYISLLTIIAQANTHLKNYDLAKTYYQKILHIEPNYAWVKNELYPQLIKLSNNNTI